MIRGSEVQAGTHRPVGDQHDRRASLILEVAYHAGTVAGLCHPGV